jgi:hypothetical protein
VATISARVAQLGTAWTGRHTAVAVAAVLWAAEFASAALGRRMDDPVDRLISCLTICWTFVSVVIWFASRHDPRRGRWVTLEELASMERVMLAGLRAGQEDRAGAEPPRSRGHLRGL